MYNQPQLVNNNYTPLSRYATQVDMSDIDILKEMNDDDQSNYINKMFTFLKTKLQGLNTNDAEFPNYVAQITSQIENLTEQAIKIAQKSKQEKFKLKEECMNLKEQLLIQKSDTNELRTELKEMNLKQTRLLEDVNKDKHSRPNTGV